MSLQYKLMFLSVFNLSYFGVSVYHVENEAPYHIVFFSKYENMYIIMLISIYEI